MRRSCEGEGGYRPYARTMGSISTIYRVLRAAGESRERRALAKLLLVRNTVLLAAAIFACNALLHHSWIESLLFATRDRDRAHAAAPASAKNHVPSLCGGIGDSARGRFDKDRRRSRPSRLLRRQGWHPSRLSKHSRNDLAKEQREQCRARTAQAERRRSLPGARHPPVGCTGYPRPRVGVGRGGGQVAPILFE